jgi:hypothetical protein
MAFFDIRSDSDALFAHFNVALQGVERVSASQNESINPMLKQSGSSKERKTEEGFDSVKYIPPHDFVGDAFDSNDDWYDDQDDNDFERWVLAEWQDPSL